MTQRMAYKTNENFYCPIPHDKKLLNYVIVKLITFIRNLLSIRKTYSTLFSEALAEGIKEMSVEMGYHFKDQDKVNRITGLLPDPLQLESADGKTSQDG